MFNINKLRQVITARDRKLKRQEIISLKRKLNSQSYSQSYTSCQDLQKLFDGILNDSPESYAELARLSLQPMITSLLISEDQSEIIFHLINALQAQDPQIVQYSLTIIGHITYNQNVAELIDYDIIPSLIANLSHNKRIIRELSVWVLSNIASEEEAYATRLLNNIQLIDKIGSMLLNDNSKIKVEVLYLYKSLISNGETNRLVEYLSDDDLFVAIRTGMKQENEEYKNVAQEIFMDILRLGHQISNSQINVFKVKMGKVGADGIGREQIFGQLNDGKSMMFIMIVILYQMWSFTY